MRFAQRRTGRRVRCARILHACAVGIRGFHHSTTVHNQQESFARRRLKANPNAQYHYLRISSSGSIASEVEAVEVRAHWV